MGGDILLRKETKHNSNINIIPKLPSWDQPYLVFYQDAFKYWSFGKLHFRDLFPFHNGWFPLNKPFWPFWESKSNSKPSWVGQTKVVFFPISPSSTNFKIGFLTEDLVQNIRSEKFNFIHLQKLRTPVFEWENTHEYDLWIFILYISELHCKISRFATVNMCEM